MHLTISPSFQVCRQEIRSLVLLMNLLSAAGHLCSLAASVVPWASAVSVVLFDQGQNSRTCSGVCGSMCRGRSTVYDSPTRCGRHK